MVEAGHKRCFRTGRDLYVVSTTVLQRKDKRRRMYCRRLIHEILSGAAVRDSKARTRFGEITPERSSQRQYACDTIERQVGQGRTN